MDLENINYKEVMHKKFKKCEFCGRELEPIGFEYLYANIFHQKMYTIKDVLVIKLKNTGKR